MSEPPGGFELNGCQIPQGRMDAFRHVHIFEVIVAKMVRMRYKSISVATGQVVPEIQTKKRAQIICVSS
jgi:hypothetical protein